MIRLWVIYEHPDDYPESYVVRSQVPHSSGAHFGQPMFAKSLEQARDLVPDNCVVIPRALSDVPAIVESWLEIIY